MKSLNILLVLLLGVANFGGILSQNGEQNEPNLDIPIMECYRNPNGMCRFFKTPPENVTNNLGQVISWTKTDMGNCAERKEEETKVCQLQCDFYLKGYCYPSVYKVCGYSPQNKECKLFNSLCSLKQDACRSPGTKDWRVAKNDLCRGLRVNGPAVPC